MTAHPSWLALRAVQADELDRLIRAAERARRPGEVALPPTPASVEPWAHIVDTALTRWACSRGTGIVEGWIVAPRPDYCDPGLYQPPMRCSDGCEASIPECDERGCREAGRCLR